MLEPIIESIITFLVRIVAGSVLVGLGAFIFFVGQTFNWPYVMLAGGMFAFFAFVAILFRCMGIMD